ncbi:MAG: hypothetical protein QM790_10635 [Nibricoccus sp.]
MGKGPEGNPVLGVLRPFNPISWFHSRGIKRVLARLEPRLPDVSRCLFLTFTINPLLFADPSAAFEHARAELRKIFYKLRNGVEWQGQAHRIDVPYAVKVEFHRNEWAHFHVIFLTRRFLPAGLLNELWGLGRTNVRRITNDRFRYLLKYVTKGGTLPDWVKDRSRLRVFQASRGFLKKTTKKETPPTAIKRKRRKSNETLGERIERYRHTALFQSGTRFSHLPIRAPFEELQGLHILPAAEERRYLGNGHFQISDMQQIEEWIPKQT